jgi:uncharacterized protein (DUF1330 family)
MKYYTLAELSVTERGWARDYVEHVAPMVERYGGRYLARTNAFEKLEGGREPPQMVLLIEWPNEEAAVAFYESEEYRPYRERGLARRVPARRRRRRQPARAHLRVAPRRRARESGAGARAVARTHLV